MVSKGHYVCGICGGYIRPVRQGKRTGQTIVSYLLKIWKNSITGNYYEYHTKAHKKCLKKLKKGGD